MDFLKLFLRGVALLPTVIQGVEVLYGSKTGKQKRLSVVTIISAAINMGEAIAGKTIVEPTKFKAGLGMIVDGVVGCLNASVWGRRSAG